jgi:hypothetical protein
MHGQAAGKMERGQDRTRPFHCYPPFRVDYCTTTCNGMLWTTFTVAFVCDRVKTLAVPVTITV